MELLKHREQRRSLQREQLRAEVRARLKQALHQHLPDARVLLFGSITRPGAFHRYSDVDVALWQEPGHCSVLRLQSLLEEAVGRPVDLVLLSESRFRQKIETEGERWTT